MIKYLLLLLAACNPPHVDPLPRTSDQQLAGVVSVRAWCDDVTQRSTRATGVVISENRVLTAAHAVRCAAIPIAWVTLPSGREIRMQVERDDAMFGGGTDVARLRVGSLETFDLDLAPPELDEHYGGPVTVRTRHGSLTGSLYGDQVRGVEPVPGDSGSPVYSDVGRLVSIILRADGSVQRIGDYWLEGT